MNLLRMATKGARVARNFFMRNSENICAIGAGIAATKLVYDMVKAVPEVTRIVKEKKEDYDSCMDDDKETKKEVVWEGVKEVTPVIIKPAFDYIACIGFIAGGNIIAKRKQAALAMAYSMSQEALDTYDKKLEEIVGKKKADDVREAVAQDNMGKNEMSVGGIIETGHGTQLFFMPGTGTWFRSSPDFIRLTFSRVNERLSDYEEVDFNDILDDLGLERCKYGEYVGWSARDGERAEVDLRQTGMFVDRVTGHEEPAIFISSNETLLTNVFGDFDWRKYKN